MNQVQTNCPNIRKHNIVSLKFCTSQTNIVSKAHYPCSLKKRPNAGHRGNFPPRLLFLPKPTPSSLCSPLSPVWGAQYEPCYSRKVQSYPDQSQLTWSFSPPWNCILFFPSVSPQLGNFAMVCLGMRLLSTFIQRPREPLKSYTHTHLVYYKK